MFLKFYICENGKVKNKYIPTLLTFIERKCENEQFAYAIQKWNSEHVMYLKNKLKKIFTDINIDLTFYEFIYTYSEKIKYLWFLIFN